MGLKACPEYSADQWKSIHSDTPMIWQQLSFTFIKSFPTAGLTFKEIYG